MNDVPTLSETPPAVVEKPPEAENPTILPPEPAPPEPAPDVAAPIAPVPANEAPPIEAAKSKAAVAALAGVGRAFKINRIAASMPWLNKMAVEQILH